jgi:exodeoxyribonuclease VII small subunit
VIFQGRQDASNTEENMELKVKDFETALKSLEEIVTHLEAGDLALDRALELFEEGIKISRFCNAKLEEAERKVEMLIKSADGTLQEVPFPDDQGGGEP